MHMVLERAKHTHCSVVQYIGGRSNKKLGCHFEGLMRRKQAHPGELEHSNIIFYPHEERYGHGAFKHCTVLPSSCEPVAGRS
jgi:hypothetical protein